MEVNGVTISESDELENNTMTEAVNGSDKFHAILESEMSMIPQTGRIAQNNFVTISQAQDYDYMEGKRIVSLEEAVGIREVSAKTTPGGPSPA